ncbi:30S ribosomal protein S4 [Candidatus Saccharibacteria bacterium]|jgi:small subunit ribosomal protein S4|nr:MAG: 30S ribosomal protein S4 [Candidatus Saccharibacteria bacterium]
MARDRSSIVKQSRREGYALHPKAHKALVKRSGMPGASANGRRPNKPSQYALQMREKQKVKRLYGLLERQFENLMKEASRSRGQTGQTLLRFLEQRADNAVYRAGLAPSRRAARQLVSHGHFMLNGRRFDIPSVRLVAGDELIVRDHSKSSQYFKNLDTVSPPSEVTASWINADRKKLTIKVTGAPTRDDAELGINEQLIVEYYSR